MFRSFFTPRTPQQSRKTKRKWESCESVNEEEDGIQNSVAYLQTPRRKRVCKEQPQEVRRTSFGKVSHWIKETTAKFFRSFSERYNLQQPDEADNGTPDDSLSQPVIPNMNATTSHHQATTRRYGREDHGESSQRSPISYRRELRDDSSAAAGDWRRISPPQPSSFATHHQYRRTSPDCLTRRPLHDASVNRRPRMYDPSKYESDRAVERAGNESWSSRYQTVGAHSETMKNSSMNARKHEANISTQPLAPRTSKIHRPVTLLDSVIRLEERERYRQLVAQYRTRASVVDDSCSSKSSGGQSRRQSGAECPGRTRNVMSEQSVLGASHPAWTPRANPQVEVVEVKTPFVKKPSPVKKPTPMIVDMTRSVSEDVAKGIFQSRPKNYRQRSNKTVDIFDDGWIQKWRENLSADNIEKERQIAKEKLKLESLRKKKNEQLLQVSEEVKSRMEKKHDAIIESKVDSFPELTQEMNCIVDKALGRGAPNEQLVETSAGRLTRSDIATLGQQNWLNDEVVNVYFQLLVERSKKMGPKVHSFNTFFYPKLIKSGHASLRRWTKKVDLFAMHIVLIPIHLGMHWCLAIIDFDNKTISYYDSLRGENGKCLQALRDYLCAESLDKKKQTFDLTGWKCDSPKNIPEQLNGCDCGVFVCKYAEYISRRATFDFTQHHMPYFRRRMVYEILKKQLM